MLTEFCTEAKTLLNNRDKRGVYKLVEKCSFLDQYVDTKSLTEKIVGRAETGVKVVVKAAVSAKKDEERKRGKEKKKRKAGAVAAMMMTSVDAI
jgi:hypothetical protein